MAGRHRRLQLPQQGDSKGPGRAAPAGTGEGSAITLPAREQGRPQGVRSGAAPRVTAVLTEPRPSSASGPLAGSGAEAASPTGPSQGAHTLALYPLGRAALDFVWKHVFSYKPQDETL